MGAIKFAFLSDKAISCAAEMLRAEALGGRALEIPVDLDAILFEHLCEEDQLSVNDEAELPDENGEMVLGKTTMRPGRIEINRRLKNAADLGRYRFTVAHEIGHWVLHRAQILAALDAPDLFGARVEPSLTTLNRGWQTSSAPNEEVQANLFAAALLMDRRALTREVLTRFGHGGIREHLARNPGRGMAERRRAIAGARVQGFESLSVAFGVSGEAMGFRLEALGYLNDAPSLFA